ncbi:MAG: translation initiation factor [Thermoleophilaceae bacterium]|nr:translation initiation factor [Thermoleophilaceae bacterium]
MPKKRVHEIAKEQGITSKEVLAAFKDAGVYVKAASSTVEERDVRRAFPNGVPSRAAAGEAAKSGSSKAAVKSTDDTPATPAKPAAAQSPKEKAAAPADAAAAADRGPDGKARVPRAKATKGAHSAKAETSTEAAAKGAAAPPAPAEAPASTQRTRAAGGSAAKAKAPGAPEKPAATADAAADAPSAPARPKAPAGSGPKVIADAPAPEPEAPTPEPEAAEPEAPAPETPSAPEAEAPAADVPAAEEAPAEEAPAAASNGAAAEEASPAADADADPKASEGDGKTGVTKPPRGAGPRIIDPGTGSSGGNGGNGSSGGRSRPTRPDSGRGAGGAPATGGGPGRRRVVIDSQASRRPSGPPPPQQPPRRRRGRRRLTPLEEPAPTPTNVVIEAQVFQVNSGATVKEVAETMGVPAAEIIKALMKLGEMATLTQTLTDEAIEVLAEALDKKVEIVSAADEVEDAVPVDEDAPEDLKDRPPVVTIMGHVEHGKTSLLDSNRETEVAAGEAGGITQHIGAYQVNKNDHMITFIDTPGHQAFTAMRARGAKVTDIAVIVVAADDGVMPQTVEAIDHARAADVPIMVAVNKIDLEGADPNRVRGELAGMNLTPADWGGDTEFVDVSAKTRDGLDVMLDTIITLADIQELKANPDTDASGTVVESELDPGRGPVATVLVQRGTLHVGDALVAGAAWAKVRSMQDFRGQKVDAAPPGMPVEVLGFNTVPLAGEIVRMVEHERIARQQAAEREDRLKREGLARRRNVRVSLEDVWARAKEDSAKTNLPLIVKADVAGSMEALEDEIAKLPQGEITVEVIHDGVGGITESDVMLAAASDAVIIGFNVRPVGSASDVANREGVEIRGYSVIYQVIDELRAAMQGLLEPEEVERTVATVEVRETFRASRIGVIAGSYVVDGTVTRGAQCRLVRDGTVVYDGRISTLRRFKDDVREVQAGFECGITLENFMDVKEGDIIEVYEKAQVERTLEN